MAIAASMPAAAIDLLEVPAIQSQAASRVLLLDVADCGDGSFVAVGEHGVIIVSEDGGASWMQSDVPASVTLTGVHFPVPDSGWAVGHDGLILNSIDGGRSWGKQLDGHELNEQIIAVANLIVEQARNRLERLVSEGTADEDALEDAEYNLEDAEYMMEGAEDDVAAGPVRPLLDVWFSDELEGFVLGSYGMLLHTVDGGLNWELVSDRLDNPQAFHLNQIVHAPDGNLYIAAEAGIVFRSSDGGEQWDRLEPGYEGSFYGVIVVPGIDGNYELLAYGLRGNLFRSVDKGDSWTLEDSGTPVTLLAGGVLQDGSVVITGQAGTILIRQKGQESFTVAENPDRRVITGIMQLHDERLLLVGHGGIRIANTDGTPMKAHTETP